MTLPPGVEHGATRVVNGAGQSPARRSARGRPRARDQGRSHIPFFRRAGDDVLCTVPLTFTQVALGAEVEVPTLDGKGKLRVPAGTQPGTTLRIKGKGMPKRAGIGRGDQRIEVTVEIPTALTARQRELVESSARAR